MNKWKRRLTAAALALCLLAGSWAAALAGLRSAQTLGHPAFELPRAELLPGGGLQLTLGDRAWQLDEGTVQKLCGGAQLLPRSLRLCGLAAFAGVDLWQRVGQPAPGAKQMVLAPAPDEKTVAPPRKKE